MTDAEATTAMAAALDSRGIAYAPSESEAQALGRPYVAPAAPAPVPAAAKPAAPVETHEQMVARLTEPNLGDDTIAASAMVRPADPGAYELPGIEPGAQHTPEQTAMVGEMRTALHEAGFPISIGKLVAERINAAAEAPPNDIQKSHAQAAGLSQLRQIWGDKFESNLASTRAEIARIAQKAPGVTEWLERTGGGNDVVVIRHLHNALLARTAT